MGSEAVTGGVGWWRAEARTEARSGPGTGLRVPVLRGDPGRLGSEVGAWTAAMVEKMRPAAVWICDGSEGEAVEVSGQLLRRGFLRRLGPDVPREGRLPAHGRLLCRSSRSDVARVEGKTLVVSDRRDQVEGCPEGQASLLAKWMSRRSMDQELDARFPGCMRGRILYVIPFSMGRVGGKGSLVAVQLTDSPYVLLASRLVSRVSTEVLDLIRLGRVSRWVRCVHSLGQPMPQLRPGLWECNPAQTLIVHDPDRLAIHSFGSGYGGNAVLGKKCLSLRMANAVGQKEGWLAAHMGLFALSRKRDGLRRYIGCAFPSGCGKTNLALLDPKALPGWRLECLGDDITWLRPDPVTGRLMAMNPESGIFAVATGSNKDTNPVAIQTTFPDALFTNCGQLESGEVFWDEADQDEGVSAQTAVEDWLGVRRPLGEAPKDVSHPNARFAAPLSQLPASHRHPPLPLDEPWLPLDAILFGSRRHRTYPLVYEASPLVFRSGDGGPSPSTDMGQTESQHSEDEEKSAAAETEPASRWERGAWIGVSLMSDLRSATQAAEAPTGRGSASSATGEDAQRELRWEPFGMRPFMSSTLAAFTRQWLQLGKGREKTMPRVFHVNWFREDPETGYLLWPGFAENLRVLEWVVRRVEEGPDKAGLETESGQLSLLGIVPKAAAIQLDGLGLDTGRLFDQKWLSLGEDLALVARHVRAQAGADFPEQLLRQAFRHLRVSPAS